tara:strand:- start:115 stop:978 length:864 start_codon:yes stop_codon:yes gene_type:complete
MSKKIILGTAQFGMNYGIANKSGKIRFNEIFKILNYLKKNKINSLDTASSYIRSEKEIGKYYKKTNKKFQITTKFTFKNKKNIQSQFIKSFSSLGYVPNTILAHNYKDYLNPNFHKEINVIKKKYPIKNIGVSLYNVAELNKILNYKKPDLIQIPLNILDKRFLNKKIIKTLKRKNIKIQIRSVFLQGLFFKKKKFIFKNFKNIKKKYERLLQIANSEKMCLGYLSLNWAFNLKEIDYIVLGVDSFAHLKKNLNIVKKKLSKKTYSQIDKINVNNNNIIKPNLWKKK